MSFIRKYLIDKKDFMKKKILHRYIRVIELIKKYSVDIPIVLSIGWLESSNPFLFGDIYGIDNFIIPDNHLRNCRIKNFKSLFYGDACVMPEIPSNVFNVAEVCEVLEHVVNPIRFISEIHRILKLNGVLIISTPNGGCLYRNLIFKNPNIKSYHVNIWNIKHLINLIKKFGFKCVHIEGYDASFNKFLLLSRDVILVFIKNTDIKDEWVKKLERSYK
jgi:SAM-dependent methyltransferase